MGGSRRAMYVLAGIWAVLWIFLPQPAGAQESENISAHTRACLGCHETVTPGIVSDWKNSRMAKITPAAASEKPARQMRVSFDSIPEDLANAVVGCAECHTLDPEQHEDTFSHGGRQVHTVVTPEDCAACHPVERQQFSQNLMAEAYGNLMDNTLYDALITAASGPMKFTDKELTQKAPDAETNADACLFCHGTKLKVKKIEKQDTAMGPMEMPEISGWPNQGVGRINPDGSKGNCAACHTRHRFSIETARKPDTCSQCHKGPDVPAYKVYKVSKHGNIYGAMKNSDQWDFSAVPWTVGTDMEAPTCATCHMSLLSKPGGQVVAERTHRMNDRLGWRIFGLPYAHAHPESADTSVIRNKNGLPLPTALDGTPAEKFLISEKTREERNRTMQQVCLGCHSSSWVSGHFRRLEHTIDSTNAQTRTATEILQKAWDAGIESGPAAGGSPFDESLERMWVESWLFYANSTRFASAMGGADYGVFENGRWHLTRNTRQMLDLLKLKQKCEFR
ncbi:MAG: multiheme c-type cytochrome [Desulfobacterales bacterium]